MCVIGEIHMTLSIMGWLQFVGSIKLYVSFAKETYKRDNILQKRLIILSTLLSVDNTAECEWPSSLKRPDLPQS